MLRKLWQQSQKQLILIMIIDKILGYKKQLFQLDT